MSATRSFAGWEALSKGEASEMGELTHTEVTKVTEDDFKR